MKPQQTPSEARHYENPALWTAARYLSDEAELRRFNASSALLPDSAATLLDVGTGNGAFLRYLEDQNTALNLLGLERSPTAREAAVCRAEIRAGSADALPFGDQSFDVVAALEVIEHLPFGVYEKALEEMQRVAASTILISVPFREHRRRVRCPYCECSFNPNYHMRSFDEGRIETLFPLFKLARFEIVCVPEYIFMPVVRLWRRALRPKPFPASAICPQCGYSQNVASTARTARKKPLSFIPLWQRPNWVVARYQRIPQT